LEIDRSNPNQTPAVRNGINRYNFLGKETQVATGYIDLQARFYDPLIGRFMQVDPETEGQDEFSPFHYSFNNPIRFSEGFWKNFISWLNGPISKGYQDAGRGAMQATTGVDITPQTRGEFIMAMAGNAGKAFGGNRPGSFKIPNTRRIAPKSAATGPGAKPAQNSIKTPYGAAEQSTSTAAQTALKKVNSGADLCKLGTTGRSEATGSQFWSLENPLINSAQYAQKYGIPLQNIEKADFLMVGTASSNSGFITREAPTAPGAPKNSGGGIEVVTTPDAVKVNTLHYIPKEDYIKSII
jgi:RHS repeat-associated protein